jgi:hypothetical protein
MILKVSGVGREFRTSLYPNMEIRWDQFPSRRGEAPVRLGRSRRAALAIFMAGL